VIEGWPAGGNFAIDEDEFGFAFAQIAAEVEATVAEPMRINFCVGDFVGESLGKFFGAVVVGGGALGAGESGEEEGKDDCGSIQLHFAPFVGGTSILREVEWVRKICPLDTARTRAG